jgi:beta-mannanase
MGTDGDIALCIGMHQSLYQPDQPQLSQDYIDKKLSMLRLSNHDSYSVNLSDYTDLLRLKNLKYKSICTLDTFHKSSGTHFNWNLESGEDFIDCMKRFMNYMDRRKVNLVVVDFYSKYVSYILLNNIN